MFDSLDLAELQGRARRYRWEAYRNLLVMLGLMVMLIVGVAVITDQYQRNTSELYVYSFRANNDVIGTNTCEVELITLGFNSVAAVDCKGLRVTDYNGKVIQKTYDQIGYRSKFIKLIGSLASIWAIGDDGTVAYANWTIKDDGTGFFNNNWQLFFNVLDKEITDVAISDTKLVVITDQNVIQYVTSTGETGFITPPTRSDLSYTLSSYEGSIYLAYEGIWKLNDDKSTWTKAFEIDELKAGEFINLPDSATLMYKTMDAIYWLMPNDEYGRDRIVERYTTEDIGIPIDDVIAADLNIFVTQTKAISTGYKQTRAWLIPIDNSTQIVIHAYAEVVNVLKKGSAWLLSGVDSTLAMIGFFAAWFAIFMLWSRSTRSIASKRLDHARKLLRSLLPELPVYKPAIRSNSNSRYFLLLAAWIFIGIQLKTTPIVLVIGSWFIVGLLPYLLQLVNSTLDSDTKAYVRRQAMWLAPFTALFFLSFFALATLLPRFLPNLSQPLQYIVSLCGVVAIFVTLRIASTLPFNRVINNAFAKGDFDQALQQTRLWQRTSPGNPNCILLEETILLGKGDLQGASAAAYRFAAEVQNLRPDYAMVTIGDIKTLKKEDDAEALLVGALESSPERIGAYLVYGNWLLMNDKPQEAKLLMDIAPLEKRKPFMLSIAIWEARLVLKAQILALTGETAKAEALLTEMLNGIPVIYRQRRAAVLYSLGVTMEASGDVTQGSSYYQQTRDLLPESLYAIWAGEKLEALNGNLQ